jgi:hypothetical protein
MIFDDDVVVVVVVVVHGRNDGVEEVRYGGKAVVVDMKQPQEEAVATLR